MTEEEKAIFDLLDTAEEDLLEDKMLGPGKYDDVCTIVRETTNALCAMVVIIGGNKGAGFSVQTSALALLDANVLAALLEDIARQLRGEEE